MTAPPPPPGFVPVSQAGAMPGFSTGSSTMPGFSAAPQDDAPPPPPPGFVPVKPAQREVTGLGERILTGLMDPIVGAAQIADRHVVDPFRQAISPGASNMEDYVRQRDAEYVAPEGVDWARAGGNVANPLTWAGGGSGALPALVRMGAAQGILNPTEAGQEGGEFLLSKAKQAAIGGAGGAAGGVLSKAVGRAFKPIGDEAADTVALRSRGIEPTFGQAMAQKEGAEGLLGRAINVSEEAAGSVPFASAPLRASRERGLEQWRAATRREGAPAGTTAPTDSVDEVRAAWNDAYEGVLGSHRLPYASVTYQPDMRRITQGLALSADDRRMVQEVFEDLRLANLQNPTPGVQPTAAAAHAIESELKTQAAGYGASGEHSQRQIGQAFERLARDYGRTWRGALPADTSDAIAQLDRRYPAYVSIRQAAKTVGAKASEGDPNQYTPAGLWGASRVADRSFMKRAHIAGNAPQQELARLGQAIQNKLPDSGTATRAGVGATILGGAGIAGLAPQAIAGSLLLAGYGTRQVQDWLMGRASPAFQQAVLDLLRGAAPGAAGLGGAMTQQLGE